MKQLFTLLILNLLTSGAGAVCPDLSGKYSSPFDTEETKTVYIFTQTKCDWISVTSLYFQPGVTTTRAEYSLDGTPARNCLMDFFNNCGSLKAVENAIEKTDPKMTQAGDEEHGFCRFQSSLLTKEANGNISETVVATQCEDGYSGPLKARIYPKIK